MKFIDKTLYQIAFSCFIAQSLSKISFLAIGVLTYEAIGFDDYKVARIGLLGCLPLDWRMVFMFFLGIFYSLTLLFVSYSFSKKGFETQKTIFILIGALFFFPLFDSLLHTIIVWHNPLWFSSRKAEFSSKLLPVFRNLYNLKIAQFISWIIKDLLTIIVGFLTVYRFWSKELKIKFLTIGSISALAGMYFWYYFLGKIVVSIFK